MKKDYKVSDKDIAIASVEKFRIVQNQRQFSAGGQYVRSILLPILEEKEIRVEGLDAECNRWHKVVEEKVIEIDRLKKELEQWHIATS